MAHHVERNSDSSHLMHIETHIQSDPDVDFGYADVERVLLSSIDEVREELQRRYQDALQEPLYSASDAESQIGVVYSYAAQVSGNDAKEAVPHRDLVRVYQVQSEPMDPTEWSRPIEFKESHLEEELADVVEQLLECTELNMDDMEPGTREAIARAASVLADIRPKQ